MRNDLALMAGAVMAMQSSHALGGIITGRLRHDVVNKSAKPKTKRPKAKAARKARKLNHKKNHG